MLIPQTAEIKSADRKEIERLIDLIQSAKEENSAVTQHINELIRFVEAQKIVIPITLPEPYNKTSPQRRLNRLAEENKCHANKARLEQENLPSLSSTAATIAAAAVGEAPITHQPAQRKPFNQNRTPKKEKQLEREEQVQENFEHELYVQYTLTTQGSGSGTQIERFVTNFDSLQGISDFTNHIRDNIPDARERFTSIALTYMNLERFCWYPWVGRYDVQLEPEIKGIDKQAASLLLEHHSLFMDGLNTLEEKYLPKGFSIKSEGIGSADYHICYDPDATERTAIAPKLEKRVSQPLFTFALCENLIHYLTKHRGHDNHYKAILNTWDRICGQENYSEREENQLRRWLPVLIFNFSEQQIKSIIELCVIENPTTHQNELNVDLLEHFLQHYKAAAQHYEDHKSTPHDDTLTNDEKVPYGYQNKEAFEGRFSQAAKICSRPAPSAHEDFLHQQLQSLTMSDQINNWRDKLKLSSKQLAALISLQHRYGDAGVRKLFNRWSELESKGILNSLKPLFIDQSDTFIEWIDDPAMSDVLEKIKRLKESDKVLYQWWEALLKQHTPAPGLDYLPDLYAAFHEFTQEITKLNLIFYPPPPRCFPDKVNLPTRLGKILTLLHRVAEVDRAAQWECVAQLPLGFDGATKLFTNKVRKESVRLCHFVVPEMKIDDDHGKDEFKKGRTYQLDNYKDIPTCNNEQESDYTRKTKRDFYRYVAYQPDALPLRTYQRMVSFLDTYPKFSIKQKSQLLRILAGASIGKWSKDYRPNEIEKMWENLITTVANYQLPIAVNTAAQVFREKPDPQQLIIDKLGGLSHSPYLLQLEALADLIVYELDKNSSLFMPLKIFKAEERLVEDCRRLGDLANTYENAVYEGMRFYKKEAYQNKEESLLRKYLDRVEIIREKFKNHNADSVIARDLISIISHFDLINVDRDTFDQILEYFAKVNPRPTTFNDVSSVANPWNPKSRNYIFTIFQAMKGPADAGQLLLLLKAMNEIENEKRPPVSADDEAKLIIEELQPTNSYPKNSEEDLIASLEMYLKRYLPDRYLNRLRMTNKERIEAQLSSISDIPAQNQLRELIFSVNDAAQSQSDAVYKGIVDHWIKIIAEIPASEKEYFYKNCSLLTKQSSLKELDFLLGNMASNKYYYDYFQFFIVKARMRGDAYLGNKDLKLLSKTCSFVDICNTLLRDDVDLKSSFQDHIISRIDVLHLVADYLLTYDTLDNLQSFSPESKPNLDDIKSVLKAITDLARKYPGDRDLILHICKIYMQDKDPGIDGIQALSSLFITIEDMDIVRAVCAKLEDGTSSINKAFLDTLLSEYFDESLDINKKKIILKILLIESTNKRTDLSILALKLIDLVNKYPGVLRELYQNAPYPNFSAQVEPWFKNTAKAAISDRDNPAQGSTETNPSLSVKDSVLAKYADFDLKPFDREAVPPESSHKYGNGFHLQTAIQQLGLMRGLGTIRINEKDVALATHIKNNLFFLRDAIKIARRLPTKEIREKLIAAREAAKNDNLNYLTNEMKVALLAELLARTTHAEINTTQYLAIYSLLMTGKRHATTGLATGEGKSRIAMLSVASQYLAGKTVDFVSSDMGLVLRDYLEYRPFFEGLGAPVNLITTKTPPAGYRMDGINFTTGREINLFRAQAICDGLTDQVLAPPNERGLVIDEGDLAYTNLATLAHNYSAATDPTINDIPWAYGLIISYMTRDGRNPRELKEMATQQELLDYAAIHLTADQQKKFMQIKPAQLEVWQSMAMDMFALVLGKDFTIMPDEITQTKLGPKVASQVQVLDEFGRPDKDSTYILGTHQLLCAWLNFLRQHPDQLDKCSFLENSIKDNLRKKLAECKTDFYISNETQVIHSSNHHTLLDLYKRGLLYTSTATPGTDAERKEAELLYAADLGDDNFEKMLFIDMPRHNSFERKDQAVLIGENEEEQFAAIAHKVQNSITKQRPTLIFCEDDQACERLEHYLKNDKELSGADMTHLSAKTSHEEEAEYVKQQAGKPGKVTIVAKKLARGTHIELVDQAKEQGLAVYVTYLPDTVSDLLQMLGRAGRFGSGGKGTPGRTRLILNKEMLRKKFHDKLGDELLFAAEAYLDAWQHAETYKSQLQRLMELAITDYHKNLTDEYFAQHQAFLRDSTCAKTIRHEWQVFFSEIESDWEAKREAIQLNLDSNNPLEGFEQQFREHVAYAKQRHAQLESRLQKGNMVAQSVSPSSGSLPTSAPSQEPKERKILNKIQQATPAKVHQDEGKFKPLVVDKASHAHAGKAVLYSSFSARIAALFTTFLDDWRQWRKGTGELFPNYRAWRKGKLTFGQFLSGVSSPSQHSNPSISHLIGAKPRPRSPSFWEQTVSDKTSQAFHGPTHHLLRR